MKLMDKAKQAALAAAVKTGLGYLERDPEVNIPKLMELVDKFVPDGWYESQRNAIRNAIQDMECFRRASNTKGGEARQRLI